ncbi:hypothetical protein NliqN6_4053 [Naganishia liquefaciens]|uniref:Lactonase family protein n=1 Tax=Naganishia liquefaciens TaxID=104408 RepID=A0A8H3TVD9_9TREE|nr:hypothetical protein NliqN6_4053 [Naganishia liquefaciens]
MDAAHLFTASPNDVIPILCGTFTSIYLYVLQFSTLTRQLTIQSRVPAHGAHQYLALSPGRDTLYATSWAWPPSLYSFHVAAGPAAEDKPPVVELTYQGKTPITAISSYITLTNSHIYSIGGPTGEVHARPNASSLTGFGEKLQEVLFVPQDQLEGWDKTNKALRYGAHGIEFDPNGRAYIPDLGANAIWVHQMQPDGTLELVKEVKSARDEDGPRHAVVSANGKCLYAVTEHTQFVDVYDITEQGLDHVHSASMIPQGADPHDYRGDTIRLSATTPFVFATTRGKDASTRGLLCAYAIDETTGHLVAPGQAPAAVYETPTNGGKANAIEVVAVNGRGKGDEREWIVLTDDSDPGLVVVISWNGEAFEEVSRVELMQGDGASHAVWLE